MTIYRITETYTYEIEAESVEQADERFQEYMQATGTSREHDLPYKAEFLENYLEIETPDNSAAPVTVCRICQTLRSIEKGE